METSASSPLARVVSKQHLEACQLANNTTEINAAVTISSLVRDKQFDLTSTYFMVAGIAGVNPEVATICGVTFARYAVQVAMQYEFDPREIPANFSTGYIPQGSDVPDEYPQSIYGTEVFEVNQNLQKIAATFARKATLNDSDDAIAYRALYAPDAIYAAGSAPNGPQVYECDVATSDVCLECSLMIAQVLISTRTTTLAESSARCLATTPSSSPTAPVTTAPLPKKTMRPLRPCCAQQPPVSSTSTA